MIHRSGLQNLAARAKQAPARSNAVKWSTIQIPPPKVQAGAGRKAHLPQSRPGEDVPGPPELAAPAKFGGPFQTPHTKWKHRVPLHVPHSCTLNPPGNLESSHLIVSCGSPQLTAHCTLRARVNTIDVSKHACLRLAAKNTCSQSKSLQLPFLLPPKFQF